MWRKVAYIATAVTALSWVAAGFFGIHFARIIWALVMAWGSNKLMPTAWIVPPLMLPSLGFGASLGLSLSAILYGHERTVLRISVISLALCAVFVGAILMIEHSK
jgi:hypothetical protein